MDGSRPRGLLSVRRLTVDLETKRGALSVVRGIDYDVDEGQTIGIVGESGSGKTLSALALLSLHPAGVRYVTGGSATFDGRELLGLPEERLSAVRGGSIGMVFQDPMAALNPVKKIGTQIAESARLHLGLSDAAARDRARELLEFVGIPGARHRLDDYPHRFSGGMRQRVMIAIALAGQPRMLIADEPTTALDVTIQAQILDLLAHLRRDTGLSIVIITHDLGVLAAVADSVLVMYAGRIVERGPTAKVMTAPDHPYTAGLLASQPRLDVPRSARLTAIRGSPPSLDETTDGCAFAPRCDFVEERCIARVPDLEMVDRDHWSACVVHPFAAVPVPGHRDATAS